ncbi:MAG TPA: hypothetical protein PKG52_04240 [bacterium]|nr:hypothetical protein [bacterium]HPS28699.1 hypothetical protein [bacterium]
MKNINDIGFLGTEFLLWLYWKSCEEGTLSLEDQGLGEVHISIEEAITLVSVTGDGYSETVKSQDITELRSVKESIKAGRLPDSAKIKIISNELDYQFQIKANPLKISAVKLPLSGEREEVQVISSRLETIAKLDLIMKAAFDAFLIEREGKTFTGDLKKFLEI